MQKKWDLIIPRLKKNITPVFFIVFVCCPCLINAQERKLIGNPAAIYCTEMGYQYEVKNDHIGNEFGVCIFPDGSDCDAWDFFKGKAGKSFSYCAEKGYDTEIKRTIKGSYYTESALCSPRSNRVRKAEEKILMLDLMKKNQEPIAEKIILPGKSANERKIPNENIINKSFRMDENLPASFDWRDKDGHSYIGPVRNQGDCGACYSFGAVAAAEGRYNYATGSYDDNCADFSEAFLAWCLGGLSKYSPNFYGCEGADYSYSELTAITEEGITWETNYPYTGDEPESCNYQDDPLIFFDSWHRIDSLDIDGIKKALSTYGVLDVAVYVTDEFESYASGVFINDDRACLDGAYTTTNHAVSLVGWGNDAVGGDYWILRNSWGASWGENGYMRIGLRSASVACAGAYLIACTDSDSDGYYKEPGCGSDVDCNDSDASVYPGAIEVCDDQDNNCDGEIDEGEVCCSISPYESIVSSGWLLPRYTVVILTGPKEKRFSFEDTAEFDSDKIMNIISIPFLNMLFANVFVWPGGGPGLGAGFEDIAVTVGECEGVLRLMSDWLP